MIVEKELLRSLSPGSASKQRGDLKHLKPDISGMKIVERGCHIKQRGERDRASWNIYYILSPSVTLELCCTVQLRSAIGRPIFRARAPGSSWVGVLLVGAPVNMPPS